MRRSASVAVLGLLAVLAAACTAIKEGDSTGDGLPPPVTDAPPITEVPVTTTPPTSDPDAPAAPTLADARVELLEVATLEEPVGLVARPGDQAVYVAERGGRVRRIAITTRQNGAQSFAVDRTPALDIRDDVLTDGTEQGLLGITFSTDGNRLYVAYTGNEGDQHLDEYRMSLAAAQANTRREILVIEDFAENHNGGGLAFGPDGFLYWGMGDGGGGGDPENTGQDPSDLLGSLLRIDPDVSREQREFGLTYAVPDSNPFASGTGGAPEVWAYGLRNPWRFSFDRATGDLWIGDVGQGDVEEVDHLPSRGGTNAGRAANLGWSINEGSGAFQGRTPRGDVTLLDPVYQYTHGDGGCSVTGGYVYRGLRIAGLGGAYVFGDFCLGDVQAFVMVDGAASQGRSLGVNVAQLSSFGEDNEGELWALSLSGPVYRLVAAA